MNLERLPANVLGLFGSIAAGVIRGLAKDNIIVHGYDFSSSEVKISDPKRSRLSLSNKLSEVCIYPSFSKFLNTLHSDYEPIILPTTDTQIDLLDENKNVLSDFMRFPRSNTYSIDFLQDKKNIISLAEKIGVNTPKTHRLSESDPLYYHCMIKPNSSVGTHKNDIYYFENKKQYLAKRQLLKSEYSDMVVQEFIDGGSVVIVDALSTKNNGVIVAGMQKRVAGLSVNGSSKKGIVSAMLESTWIDSLEEQVVALANEFDFNGPVNMDFVEKDGKYYFLESNFRFGANVYLDVLSGLNLPALTYRELAGEPLDDLLNAPRKLGVKMLYEHTFLRYAMNNPLHALSLYSPLVNTATFSWDDPLPALTIAKDRIKDILKRRLNK